MDTNEVLMLLNIQREVNYIMNKRLKSFGLGRHDIYVLKAINENDGISQNSICALIDEDKITVSKAVKKLVDKGFIEKLKNLDDRRSTNLYMTELGCESREQLLNVIDDANELLLKKLNSEEHDHFSQLLKKVYIGIKNESSRLD